MSDGNSASEWVPTGSVTVRVPGKVNLYLAVGDRRDDGYHELTTVFHAVSLLDEITVINADVLSLKQCAAVSMTVGDNRTSRSRSRSRFRWRAVWRAEAPTPRPSWWP